jgi:hypothetical protein
MRRYQTPIVLVAYLRRGLFRHNVIMTGDRNSRDYAIDMKICSKY